MSREELLAGYIRVLNELYEPQAYFERTEALYLQPSFDIGIYKLHSWLRLPRLIPAQIVLLLQAFGLFARLMTRVREPRLKREYRKRLWRFLKVHRRPGLILSYVFHLTMHYHAHQLATRMVSPERQLVNSW
jgi:hypothetical protein